LFGANILHRDGWWWLMVFNATFINIKTENISYPYLLAMGTIVILIST
jgi:hypothetical protein